MDNQADPFATSTIKPESSVSKLNERIRRIALAEDGYAAADRSGCGNRWQHPLLKSMQTRRGKSAKF